VKERPPAADGLGFVTGLLLLVQAVAWVLRLSRLDRGRAGCLEPAVEYDSALPLLELDDVPLREAEPAEVVADGRHHDAQDRGQPAAHQQSNIHGAVIRHQISPRLCLLGVRGCR
jgi:hypothetical protein